MEQNERRIIFNEDTFTNLCKMGFLKHQSPTLGRVDIHFYKHDIIALSKGEIVSKDLDEEVFKFMLQNNIDLETVREIVKRSPIYYELSNQI